MNKLNALRVEKRLLESRLKSLETELNTGIVNTRKFQTDKTKIYKIKNRLSEIEEEVQLENKNLNKLKKSNFNITETPLIKQMFRTPPKKSTDENPLDQTFNTLTLNEPQGNVTHSQEIRENLPTSEAPHPNTENIITAPTNTDFENFITHTVGLVGAVGGTTNVNIEPKNTLPDLKTGTKLKTTYFSIPAPIKPPTGTLNAQNNPNKTKITQTYQTPTSIQKEEINLQDKLYMLEPPKHKKQNYDISGLQKESSQSKCTQFQDSLMSQIQKQVQSNIQSEKPQDIVDIHPNLVTPQQQNYSDLDNNLKKYIQQLYEHTQAAQRVSNQRIQNQDTPNQPVTQQNISQQIPQQNQLQNFLPQNLNYLLHQNNFPNNNQQFAQGGSGQGEVGHENQPQPKPRDTFLRRLRAIPKFNGESYRQLKEFIEVTDSLYVSCANQVEQNELYEQILVQLRGEARKAMTDLQIINWEAIKDKLLKDFAYLANKDTLNSQLEGARQYQGETLTAFADRVRNLLKDKNSTYSDLTPDQKKEYTQQACKAFANGVLNGKIRQNLKIRGEKSLEESIAYAIRAESEEANFVPSGETYCRKCNQPGHRFRECTRRNEDNSDISKLVSVLRSFGNQNRPIFQNHSFTPRNPNANQNMNNLRSQNWNPNFQNRNLNNQFQNRNFQNSNRNLNNNFQNRNFNNDFQNRNFNDNVPNRNYNNNDFQNRNLNNFQNRNSNFDQRNNNWSNNSQYRNRNLYDQNQNSNAYPNRNNYNNFGNRNTNYENRNTNGQRQPFNNQNNRFPNNGQNGPNQSSYNRQDNLNQRPVNQTRQVNVTEASSGPSRPISSSSGSEN